MILTATNAEDLDSSDLPFGGRRGSDFMGAFHWSVTIGVGGSPSFFSQFGSDAALDARSVNAVPEPGPVLLAGLEMTCLSLAARVRDYITGSSSAPLSFGARRPRSYGKPDFGRTDSRQSR